MCLIFSTSFTEVKGQRFSCQWNTSSLHFEIKQLMRLTKTVISFRFFFKRKIWSDDRVKRHRFQCFRTVAAFISRQPIPFSAISSKSRTTEMETDKALIWKHPCRVIYFLSFLQSKGSVAPIDYPHLPKQFSYCINRLSQRQAKEKSLLLQYCSFRWIS